MMAPSDTLRRLLSGTPEYFDLDRAPRELPGLLIQYQGETRITVTVRELRATPMTGIGAAFTAALTGHTLDTLAAEIARHAGFSAQVLAEDRSVSALCLLDTDAQDPLVDNRFYYATSLLWHILRPIEWALSDAQDHVRGLHQEMTIRSASDQWLDLWGALYGRIVRRIGEADRAYGDRIIREFKRWRLNARAIEMIIEADLGVPATVTHLHDQAWVIARTAFGRFPGPQKYLRATFEVLVDGLLDGLATLVHRNRAAGTMPFLRMRDIGGDLDAPSAEGVAHTLDRSEIVNHGVWRIAVDPLGRYPTALPRDLEVTERWVHGAGEQVTGTGAGTSFILGSSLLGSGSILGEPLQGFVLTEDEIALVDL